MIGHLAPSSVNAMKTIFSLLLSTALSASAATKKQYPRHWGAPPQIQTQDIVPLPGGYGQGSSTLGNWIRRNLERDKKLKGAVPKQKQFPAHWGPPPRIQTRDWRPLPGGYGKGSSTLARWIQLNLNRDVAAKAMANPKPLYQNDFMKEKEGELLHPFLVLDGAFKVVATEEGKLLELPGTPLDTFGVLFGPTEATNISVQARVRSANNKRRYPSFGVGLNGVGGYRLQVSAAKRRLEIHRQDKAVASVPYRWKTNSWLWLKLRVVKHNEKTWRVQGKVWPYREQEPNDWIISYDDAEEPYAGMPSIWGQPYSGRAIQYDDLLVLPVP